MITRTLSLCLVVPAFLAAAGCAGGTGNGMDAMVTDTREAGADAIGLPRERPGRIRVDEGDDTVPTPMAARARGVPVRPRPAISPASPWCWVRTAKRRRQSTVTLMMVRTKTMTPP